MIYTQELCFPPLSFPFPFSWDLSRTVLLLTASERFRSLHKQEFLDSHPHSCLGTEPVSIWVGVCRAWPLSDCPQRWDCHWAATSPGCFLSAELCAAHGNLPCSLKLFCLSVMSEWPQRPCSEMSHCLCSPRGISGQGLQLKVHSSERLGLHAKAGNAQSCGPFPPPAVIPDSPRDRMRDGNLILNSSSTPQVGRKMQKRQRWGCALSADIPLSVKLDGILCSIRTHSNVL